MQFVCERIKSGCLSTGARNFNEEKIASSQIFKSPTYKIGRVSTASLRMFSCKWKNSRVAVNKTRSSRRLYRTTCLKIIVKKKVIMLTRQLTKQYIIKLSHRQIRRNGETRQSIFSGGLFIFMSDRSSRQWAQIAASFFLRRFFFTSRSLYRKDEVLS